MVSRWRVTVLHAEGHRTNSGIKQVALVGVVAVDAGAHSAKVVQRCVEVLAGHVDHVLAECGDLSFSIGQVLALLFQFGN
ncbi:hypothetical protein D3C87_2085300 [compost metagenome]